jgi:hypothetical protein
MRTATLLALCLLAGAAYAQGGPFLFDVLLKPSYRASWERLMKEVQPTPDWLVEFSQSFNGVAGPMKPAAIEGKAYELYFVCKPHDCAANKFEVMFEAATKRAYGVLGVASNLPAFYGAPNPAMQEALTKALKG